MDTKKFRHVDIFKMLVRGMSDQGFEKTPDQMKLKLKKLKQEYINCKKNNSKSGAAPSTCPFYEELDLLFSLRPNLAVNMDCTEGIDTGDYEIEQECTDIFYGEQAEDGTDFDPGEGTSRDSNSETPHSAKRSGSNVQSEQAEDVTDFDPGEGTSRDSNSETPHSAKRSRSHVEGRKSYKAALNEYSEKLLEKQGTLINNTITKMLDSQKEMLETANREQRQWELEMLEKEQEFQRKQTETMMQMFTQCIQSLRPPTVSNLGPLRLVNLTSQRNLKDAEVEKQNKELK
ncbi:unnamed protein product [Ceutorhynchus assimilis]|uniref:Myb/SANT-like DNA-binding domain-containing protein n=1 Tax=Ceutorhynchus assimilis TaxID=467358 RepID=A0A9P0GWW9_9CUCU|nr:unnamed protein product [Ceutorhynchus assimilis]